MVQLLTKIEQGIHCGYVAVGTIISSPLQVALARFEYSWKIFVCDGNRRVGLVVLQQYVVFRFVAFDEVVLKQQRVFFGIDHDIFNVSDFRDQKTCFVALLVFVEIRADASFKILRLTHIDNSPLLVKILVTSRTVRQIVDYPFEITRKRLGVAAFVFSYHLIGAIVLIPLL